MTPLTRFAQSPTQRTLGSGADDIASALLKSGLVAFVLVDSGNVIAASPPLRELIGASAPYHHVDGQGLLSIVFEADRPAVAAFCASLLQDGVRRQQQCRLQHFDGSAVPVLLAGTSIEVDDARQLVIVVTDLSAWGADAPNGAAATMSEAFDRTTAFPTHALLLDRMQIALAAARRYRRRAAVLRIDFVLLDTLIASLVPEAALEVQAAIAETLRNCVRDCDTVARLGLRDFVVLLPEIGQREDAGISAARIVAATATLFERNELIRRVSAAIGVAVYPADGTSAERLLGAAESAMRVARDGKGGGFALADATITELAAIQPLVFREDFLVGVGDIDAEHRALVEATNDLVQDLKAGVDPGRIAAAIRAIAQLLRTHFENEARHLGTSPYEGSVDLKTRNLRFLDELQCILLHVNAQSATLATRHLYDWLVPHLLNLDYKMAS